MLNSRKLSFDILPNNCNIDIVMTIINGGERVAEIDISKEIEMLIELMVIIILRINSFLRNHDTQQYAFVFLQ